jgi:adenylate cyclase
VRYVLEGSIRRAGPRVRITAQLIEATAGGHVWAERFEDNFTDLFELQDRITERVVGALEPNLQKAEIARATSKPTGNLDAYDLYLRSLHQLYPMTAESNAEARRLLKLAIAKDARFGLAKAAYARTITNAVIHGWIVWGGPEMLDGIASARSAIAESRDDPLALAYAGFAVARMGHDLDAATTALDRAITLNPNSAMVLSVYGWTRNLLGEFPEAREAFVRAIRLSPLDVNLPSYLTGLSMALAFGEPPLLGEAFQLTEKVLEATPTHYGSLQRRIELLVMQGKIAEAQEAARHFISLYPNASISAWRRRLPHRPEIVEKMTALYRAAGIPE